MIINQNVITHSTSGITNYTDAKTFVESLSNYLKIQTELPSGLSMMSIGQNAPDQQYQNVPWLELDENNNPIAFKYFNGVSWQSIATDFAIKSLGSNLYLQSGTGEFALVGEPNTRQVTSDDANLKTQFIFPAAFNSEATPIVSITPQACSVMDSVNTQPHCHFNFNVNVINSTGFDIAYSYKENRGLVKTTDASIQKEEAMNSGATIVSADGSGGQHVHSITQSSHTIMKADNVDLLSTVNSIKDQGRKFKFSYIAIGQIN